VTAASGAAGARRLQQLGASAYEPFWDESEMMVLPDMNTVLAGDESSGEGQAWPARPQAASGAPAGRRLKQITNPVYGDWSQLMVPKDDPWSDDNAIDPADVYPYTLEAASSDESAAGRRLKHMTEQELEQQQDLQALLAG